MKALEGATIRVSNVSPRWNGKRGKVLRWLHDDWYLVEVDGKELVLDASRGEMTLW